jgi:hypothetical protein
LGEGPEASSIFPVKYQKFTAIFFAPHNGFCAARFVHLDTVSHSARRFEKRLK